MLSKAVHSTVIADTSNLLGPIETIVVIWGTGWIVNDYRRGATLDNVYGDSVSPGKCQDLRLSTPDTSITDCGAIHLKLPRSYETSIGGTDPILTSYRG